VRSPEFDVGGVVEGGQGADQFLRHSFLGPTSRLSLRDFRDLNTQQRTNIEAFIFMRGLMDECTHLGRRSVAVISVIFTVFLL
jgi:hypothetical protein